MTIYRFACTSVKTHIPDHFYQRVLRVQRRCFERVDARGHQSLRSKEFFAPGKNFQEVCFLHALNTFWSTKHEYISITSSNLLHVKYCVRSLIASKERFHFGILVAHRAYDSMFFGPRRNRTFRTADAPSRSFGVKLPRINGYAVTPSCGGTPLCCNLLAVSGAKTLWPLN